MNCEICHNDDSAVLRTAPDPVTGAIRRRRQCCRCGHRWTTFETAEDTAAELARLKGALAPVADMLKGG